MSAYETESKATKAGQLAAEEKTFTMAELELPHDDQKKGSLGGIFHEHPVAASAATLLVLTAVIVGGTIFLRNALAWESTDDAEVDGNIYQISPRISGYISAINVNDNQYVEAGTVLIEIDPADYDVSAQGARAQLADAQASAASLRFNVPITVVSTQSNLASAEAGVVNAEAAVKASERNLESARATVEEAEANAAKSDADLVRYTKLVEKEDVSRQQYDQAVAAARANQAMLAGARATAQSAEQALRQVQAKLAQAQADLQTAKTAPEQVSMTKAKEDSADAQVLERRAQLRQAELNLQYTKIIAPVSGVVYKKSTVQPGANVQPGQQLLTLIPLDQIWITANFKETQLKHMHTGDPAKLSVDAFGREYEGHVDSIGPATGAVFSILPPENATGNYVKVVQRVPVKIVLDAGQNQDHRLRPGMSVEPKVEVR